MMTSSERNTGATSSAVVSPSDSSDTRGEDVIVNRLTPLANGVRTFGYLVLIGFLTLLFIGPIIALVTAAISLAVTVFSVFLPFALIGLLVWVPYHLFTHGGEATWQRTCELAHGAKDAALAVPRRLCGGAWSRVCTLGSAARDFNRAALRVLGIFLLEAVCGALIGGLLGFLAAADLPGRREWYILAGAGFGLAVGAIVAISRLKPAAAQCQNPES
jgi:hypothetical protein